MLRHYYRLVYWKRRLTRAIPGAGPPARAQKRRLRRAAGRFRPLMVFAAIVAVVLAVSYGIGTWESSGPTQQPRSADLRAVCEQQLTHDCPGTAHDTRRQFLAQAQESRSVIDGPQGQSLTLVRGHDHD